MEKAQKLTLVFVNPLDLAVEYRIGIDDLARRMPQPFGKAHFGFAFGLEKTIAESGVVSQRKEAT